MKEPVNLNDGETHYVLYSFDKGVVKIYVDGELFDTKQSTAPLYLLIESENAALKKLVAELIQPAEERVKIGKVLQGYSDSPGNRELLKSYEAIIERAKQACQP